MGTRNGSETAVGVLQAFYLKRQWRQAELARMLGVTGETVVKVLRNLGDAGVPLTRDDSDRPQVWWTMAPGWV
jgi:DNA-binding MarR family transcriptional regulator